MCDQLQGAFVYLHVGQMSSYQSGRSLAFVVTQVKASLVQVHRVTPADEGFDSADGFVYIQCGLTFQR